MIATLLFLSVLSQQPPSPGLGSMGLLPAPFPDAVERIDVPPSPGVTVPVVAAPVSAPAAPVVYRLRDKCGVVWTHTNADLLRGYVWGMNAARSSGVVAVPLPTQNVLGGTVCGPYGCYRSR